MSLEAGRISDFVRSPHDGALISGSALCHYFLVEGPDVGQIQVIQDERDHLTIRYTRSKGPDVNFDHIKKVTADVFNQSMRISFEEVDTIPHEVSGKYRF